MGLLTGDLSYIDGNGNIVVGKVSNSTININNNNISDIRKIIDELKSEYYLNLNVIVLSINKSNINQLSEEECNKLVDIDDYYGQRAIDWKPFKDKRIIEILRECGRNLRVELSVITLSVNERIDADLFWAYIKFLKMSSIIVVDGQSLIMESNCILANMFNDYGVGGCIVVNSNLNENLKGISEKVFNHLTVYKTELAGKIDNNHIKINVSQEYEFLNAFRDIARHRLGVRKINLTFENLNDINGLDGIRI